MDYLSEFIIFIGIVSFGVLFEIFLMGLYETITGKKLKEHHYSFSRYLYLLLFPITAVLVSYFRLGNDNTIFTIFFSFAMVGTFLEWLVGFSYNKIMGVRLWSYYKYPINAYTSVLSIPLWGLAGVMFWIFAKAFS